ncbi:MAG: thioredoxin [Lachnospiraceae bacterium]|nr:thioredoxin [Lachnospiraceae bacterium]
MVNKVSDATFKTEVLDSAAPVLVDFNATWCGPCKMMAPVFDELSETYQNVKFISCDVDECPETAQEYGIMSIPSIVMFKDGKPSDPVIGAQPKKNLESFIEKFL